MLERTHEHTIIRGYLRSVVEPIHAVIRSVGGGPMDVAIAEEGIRETCRLLLPHIPPQFRHETLLHRGAYRSAALQLVHQHPSSDDRGVAIHQDRDYDPGWVVGVALTPNTRDNGACRFMSRGSYAEQAQERGDPCGYCYWLPPSHHTDCIQCVPAELEPGDLIAFRTDVWHGPSGNFTDKGRWIAYFRFIDPEPIRKP